LISLMTSDHPQTYSLPIKLFGRSRLPEPGQPGISIFDIQSRIGHSSPEVHVFFPKNLTLRRTLESAWADTPLTKPRLNHEADEKVSAALRWFRAELHPTLGPTDLQKEEMVRRTRFDEPFRSARQSPKSNSYILRVVERELIKEEQDIHSLDWADELRFGELSFSAQRVALFIRAVIRNPDVVVLDEAFSGMDDFARDKCHLFLSRGENAVFKWRTNEVNRLLRSHGPRPMESDISRLGRTKVQGLTKEQALIIVSHKKEEVPGCVREWICLPEAGGGEPPRTGQLNGPLELGVNGWREIWDEAPVHAIAGAPRIKVPLKPQELERRLNLRRERNRGKYQVMTPAQRRVILDRRAILWKRKIANESEEQREERMRYKREYQRKYLTRPDPSGETETIRERHNLRARRRREKESPERREQRRAKSRERYALTTATETPEEKAKRRERNRKHQRQRWLTEEKKDARRKYNREWTRRKFAAMTDEEKEAARTKRRLEMRVKRAQQPPEERIGAWPKLLARIGEERAAILREKRKAYMQKWRERKAEKERKAEEKKAAHRERMRVYAQMRRDELKKEAKQAEAIAKRQTARKKTKTKTGTKSSTKRTTAEKKQTSITK
jgi:ABC-type molybdenum transport system ATPase subunit/photorepair protein PhrA